MSNQHHSAAALERAFREQLVAPAIVNLLLDRHLAEVCDVCACRVQQAHASDRRHQLPDAIKSDYQYLMRVAPEKRLHAVAVARSRFASPLLPAYISDEARQATRDDPDAAVELARLAEALARRIGATLQEALAIAVAANALRAEGRLRASEREVERAKAVLGTAWPGGWRVREPSVPQAISAEITCFEASLRKDQRRLDEAEDLLLRCTADFKQIGNRVGTARSLVILAAVWQRQGRIREAITGLRASFPYLDSSPKHLRLALTAHHNLAAYTRLDGAVEDAALIVDLIQPLYRLAGGRIDLLRLRWLDGQLAAALGEHERSEVLLRALVEEFVRAGHPVLAAVAGLELGEQYLTLGRTAELGRLMAVLAPIFRAEGLGPEGAACLGLLQRALAEKRVTASLLSQVRHRLQQLAGT